MLVQVLKTNVAHGASRSVRNTTSRNSRSSGTPRSRNAYFARGYISRHRRSSTYRVVHFNPSPASLSKKIAPCGHTPAQVRCALTAVMKMSLSRHLHREAGLHSLCRRQASRDRRLLHQHRQPLSHCLRIPPPRPPATDEFWSAPAADWTSEKPGRQTLQTRHAADSNQTASATLYSLLLRQGFFVSQFSRYVEFLCYAKCRDNYQETIRRCP